ncbi:zinc fingers and homeoboxes protein 2 [Lates japonicus]|uniref:Zinc fingers and homeoboxes protein 2 n=1 Tax=Lates japonicus TaxID=270547 RepID=A0AAD3M7S6_LATJO|nr:zinc fingers and homeoboxes protein 2 [Lates japonicus]
MSSRLESPSCMIPPEQTMVELDDEESQCMELPLPTRQTTENHTERGLWKQISQQKQRVIPWTDLREKASDPPQLQDKPSDRATGFLSKPHVGQQGLRGKILPSTQELNTLKKHETPTTLMSS